MTDRPRSEDDVDQHAETETARGRARGVMWHRLLWLFAVVACGGGHSDGTPCGPVICGPGTSCCDHCVGSCVPENSGAQCPDDNDPNRTCSQACGATASCNVDTEVCVGVGPIGPSVAHSCKPAPSQCLHDRSCACVSAPLCPSGTIACSNVATNEIFCDNGTQ